MNDSVYLQKAKPVWDELTRLLEKARRHGARGLTADELAELDRLYRLSTIHLAQLRLRTTNHALIDRLERLVAKAHSLVYIAPRRDPLRRVLAFYAVGFARTVARTWRFHAAAAAIFLASSAFAHYASLRDDAAAYALLAGEEIRLPGATPEQLEAVMRAGRDDTLVEKLGFSSFLLTHNTKVGFKAFALGVLGCVPTVFLLLATGGQLGAFTAVHRAKGVSAEMWAWLLPHGVTELSAVVLCGGAGFMLGMALLRPGYAGRAESLRAAGAEALRIALGVVPMFVIAGFIEGVLRQSHLSTAARLAFAAATALLWAVYFRIGFHLERNEDSS